MRDPVFSHVYMARFFIPVTRILGVILIGFFSGASQAQTAKEAVLQAIESNPDVQASWHAYKAAVQEVKIARAGYWPTVDLSASTGNANRDYDERSTYSTTQGEISLTQMLFNGFKTSSEVKYFNNASLVRYYELMSSVETTALEAVRAYEDVVRTRELVELARANHEKHREVYNQIEDRAQSGVGRRVDLEQVAGRLALAESNLLTEASNLHDVTARYLRVVGKLPEDALDTSALSNHFLPGDIKEALQMAYAGNPGFHASIKNITAAQARVKSERSGYYPKAALRARQVTNRNVSGFDDRTDPDKFGDESAVELSLTYNLFSGGANRAAVRRALEEVNLAKDQRDQACMDLRQTTQIAFNDSQRIKEQLISLEQHKRSSDKVRKAYYDQFNIGQRTLLDLLDAENEYFQASRSLVVAQGDLEIAHARALTAMGKLLSSLEIAPEGVELLKNVNVDDQLDISGSLCPDHAPVALGREQLLSEVNHVDSGSLFDAGSSVFKSGATGQLDKLIAAIRKTPNVVAIHIDAHTNISGTDALNLSLSKARAQRVRDYLVLNGLEVIPMSIAGFSAKAVADNATAPEADIYNRIEITVNRKLYAYNSGY